MLVQIVPKMPKSSLSLSLVLVDVIDPLSLSESWLKRPFPFSNLLRSAHHDSAVGPTFDDLSAIYVLSSDVDDSRFSSTTSDTSFEKS